MPFAWHLSGGARRNKNRRPWPCPAIFRHAMSWSDGPDSTPTINCAETTKGTIMTTELLQKRAKALQLNGLLCHWPEVAEQPWLPALLEWEETERGRRSLERRIRAAHLGAFKPLCDFDWSWPAQCDRATIEELMGLDFLKVARNIVLIGPNGVGKTTLARNLAYQALIHGHTVLFTSAGQMLSDLAALDSDSALRRRLRYYAAPDLLCVDEVGYLSYGNRHADLFFELINRRYEQKSLLLTTNKSFSEWNQVFPSAACVVSMIDRIIHHADIVHIDGDSYRAKEASEQAEKRAKQRKASKRT
jgi:DNA replication protein DnaC